MLFKYIIQTLNIDMIHDDETCKSNNNIIVC